MSSQLGKEIAVQQTLAASQRGDVEGVRYWSEKFSNHHVVQHLDGHRSIGPAQSMWECQCGQLSPIESMVCHGCGFNRIPRGRRKAK